MRFLIGLLALLAPIRLAAQNPDLALTQAERDSILATYHQIFPIWGRKAVERGFDLPTPLGFNIGSFAANQDIHISNLGLGFNNPAQPVSFIKFKGAQAKLVNFNARIDLWVLPFLNIYGMVGTGPGRTTVHISEPVQFTTTAEFKGTNLGLGFTGAFGIKRNFGVIDFNHQWAQSDLISAPVPVNVFSARWGRAFRVGQRAKRMRMTAWVGTMFQTMKNATNGSINLADVIPPGTDSLFNNYQNSAWYQALSPAEKALVDNMVLRLQGRLDTTVVNYSLNKKVADPWNMLVGGTFDYGRHWGLRAEIGFIGRVSALIMANYRVPL
ncbi:MAG TPA: hypothetical protein VKD28_04985 [Gemmatimonadales bacterium]|nr:hypothetical protein [Gemmatimonadales bacterium]